MVHPNNEDFLSRKWGNFSSFLSYCVQVMFLFFTDSWKSTDPDGWVVFFCFKYLAVQIFGIFQWMCLSMPGFPQVHSASAAEGHSFQLLSGSLLLAVVWKPEISWTKTFNVSFQMFSASLVHLRSVIASPFQGLSSPAIRHFKQLHLLLVTHLPRLSSFCPQLR